MITTINIFLIAIPLVFITFVRHVKKRRHHPPGPLGLPYVGILPFQAFQIVFAKYLPKVSLKAYFRQMKEKYGYFWSVEVGRQRIVTLASFDLIDEAFVQHGNFFSGKPITRVFDVLSERQGILLIDGELWKENREMAIRSFCDMGMMESHLEKHISHEANTLIEYLKSLGPMPINSSIGFIKAESNVISHLLFNECNKYDDPEFEVFLKNLKYAYQSEVIDTKCNFFPNLLTTRLARYVFPDVDKYFKAWADIHEYVAMVCERRRLSQIENADPRCVFDYFWKYRYEDNPGMEYDKKMHEISHSMKDLYMAGTDTANTLLGFCCLMLGRHPDIQDDLRAEIRVQTYNYKVIIMNMRKNCPKMLSFIDEIQRFCCLLPKFLHRVTKPCTLRGYQLFAEDIVLGDWGTVSRDKCLFDNPDVFDPYRFMDQSRTRYIPNKYMIPFGIGKRACLGEGIATMELFLFLSRMIITFDISLPYNTENNFEEILEGRMGLIHAPLEHEIKLDLLSRETMEN